MYSNLGDSTLHKLLKETIKTSAEVRDFRDLRLRDILGDEKYKCGYLPDPYVLEAETLVREVMDRLSFLQPVVKKFPYKGSVNMKVGIYSDEEHDLDKFANQLGFRSWKVAVLIYLALEMEDRK